MQRSHGEQYVVYTLAEKLPESAVIAKMGLIQEWQKMQGEGTPESPRRVGTPPWKYLERCEGFSKWKACPWEAGFVRKVLIVSVLPGGQENM